MMLSPSLSTVCEIPSILEGSFETKTDGPSSNRGAKIPDWNG